MLENEPESRPEGRRSRKLGHITSKQNDQEPETSTVLWKIAIGLVLVHHQPEGLVHVAEGHVPEGGATGGEAVGPGGDPGDLSGLAGVDVGQVVARGHDVKEFRERGLRGEGLDADGAISEITARGWTGRGPNINWQLEKKREILNKFNARMMMKF